MNTKEIVDAFAEYRDAEGNVLDVGDKVYWHGAISQVAGFEGEMAVITYNPGARREGPKMRLTVMPWELRKRELR